MNSFLAAFTWDLDPVLIEIGSFEVRYYGLLWALSFFIGFMIAKKIYKNEGIDEKLMDPLLYAAILGGVLGARLGHVFFYDWPYFSNHIEEILLPIKFTPDGTEFTGFAGLASHGGAAGIIIAMWWYSKKKIKKPLIYVLDIVAIPTALAAFFIRIANFMNSEIVGNPYDGPTAVLFKGLENDRSMLVNGVNVARHPAQLYEAVCYLVIFGILMFGYWKKDWFKYKGRILGTFLATLFTARFFIEFVKNPQGSGDESLQEMINFSTGQLLSIPFVLIGLYLIWKSRNSINAEA